MPTESGWIGRIVKCAAVDGFESHSLYELNDRGFVSTQNRWEMGDIGFVIERHEGSNVPFVKLHTSRGHTGWAHIAWVDLV